MSSSTTLDFSASEENTTRFAPICAPATVLAEGRIQQERETEYEETFRNLSTAVFSERVAVECLRMNRLRKYRLIFGLLSLICLLGLAVCLYLRIPYEPSAALFFSFFGVFAVFVLKVRDASTQ